MVLDAASVLSDSEYFIGTAQHPWAPRQARNVQRKRQMRHTCAVRLPGMGNSDAAALV